MKKVKVIKVDNYVITLEDNNKKEYIKNIEFYNIDLKEGDIIYISDEVLEEDNIYTYGPVKEDAAMDDLIKIIKEDKSIYLQRYYG